MATEIQTKNLVFYSQFAFYPMHWEAFRYLCLNYPISGMVIAATPPNLPSVHQQLGWVDVEMAKQEVPVKIYQMPEGARTYQTRWLHRQLSNIQPDAIWVQEEPTDPFLLHILGHYWFNRKPRIVTAVCENIFTRGSWLTQLKRRMLWSRLDGLLAVATASIEGVREVGMPRHISAIPLVAGALFPPGNLTPISLPFNRTSEDFIIGFVGRICEEKGWKVLLSALRSLPSEIKCLLAGDGPQLEELKRWLTEPAFQNRVFYLGLLPKETLWQLYSTLDCLVVPSLTFPKWKEQFGGVIADGMAIGLPLIGSDSGAIPEVIGNSGLIVPENNSEALLTAIEKIRCNFNLRHQLSLNGKHRFKTEFSIPAYAHKIAEALQL